MLASLAALDVDDIGSSEIRRDGNAPLGDSATQSQNSAVAFCLERRSGALVSAPAGLNIDLTHVADGKYSHGGSS
jgi:hypothetical protein